MKTHQSHLQSHVAFIHITPIDKKLQLHMQSDPIQAETRRELAGAMLCNPDT